MNDRRLMGLALAFVLACAMAAVACATSGDKEKAAAPAAVPAPAPVPPAPPVSGTVSEQTVTMTATVQKIDLAKRLATLRAPNGKVTTIKVGEQVQNLPQVKKGDRVVIGYYESLAYVVKKPGEAEPGATMTDAAARAEPGQMPAGMAARELTITATIKAIDKKTPSVTLKGPEGKLVTVKVRDPAKLEHVKVGDLVEITYTEALAISVEPAPKAAKAKHAQSTTTKSQTPAATTP